MSALAHAKKLIIKENQHITSAGKQLHMPIPQPAHQLQPQHNPTPPQNHEILGAYLTNPKQQTNPSTAQPALLAHPQPHRHHHRHRHGSRKV